jgi:hypothetical protein
LERGRERDFPLLFAGEGLFQWIHQQCQIEKMRLFFAILLLVMSRLFTTIEAQRANGKQFLLITSRWNEEFISLAAALSNRGHTAEHVRLNGTTTTAEQSRITARTSFDLIIYDRRLPIMEEHENLTNVIWFDTDMMLDADVPMLSVPAPLARYGCPEEEYKESTFRRVENALFRLSFHLSAFSQRRKDRMQQRITLSTTSFLLEARRPIPPWFIVVGRIQRSRKSNEDMTLTLPSPSKALVMVIASQFPLQKLNRVISALAQISNRTLLVVTTLPLAEVDPNATSHERENVIWIDDVQSIAGLGQYISDRIVLTSGDLSAIYSIISLGGIPVVINKDVEDYYARELAVVLKRRGLGVGLEEELTIKRSWNETLILKACLPRIKRARRALHSPVEVKGLDRAITTLEALANHPSGLVELLKIEIPAWYQYWFLDIYFVYGMVMASVFVLIGSLTNGVSSLLL